MGCMIERDEFDEDEIHIENNRSDHSVQSYYGQCMRCTCKQYSQKQRNSNQCYCGHLFHQHKSSANIKLH